MQPDHNEVIEINIVDIFYVLLGKLWIILLAGILCAFAAGLYSKFGMTPIYTSSTKIYIINRQNNETTTYNDLQTGAQLTKDYKILVLSRPVTEQVIQRLNLDITHEELVSGISVSTPEDTRILEIRVNNPDPVLAKKLADAIAEVSAQQMVSVMEMKKVNIVEPGNLPTKPSKPNVKMNTAVGGLAGGIIVVFLILLKYIMDDSIKTIDDIDKRIGITTLGTIPMESGRGFSDKKRKIINIFKRFRGQNAEHNESLAHDNTEKNLLDFSSKEAYKALRTNIQFCGKDIKTICITSCIPNEGKSKVSLRLATTIAEIGKKVLFIDADLRKSVIIGRLNFNRKIYGLSEYLSGMNNLNDVINKNVEQNLDIIFTGPLPPNPSEMLGSEAFKQLIMSQREEYDYIIIDTPPLGIVIDSANVAKVCDGTIVVVEANNVSYKFVQRILKQLEQGKCRVLGVVLNKVNINRNGYYDKYYKKNYGKYYEK